MPGLALKRFQFQTLTWVMSYDMFHLSPGLRMDLPGKNYKVVWKELARCLFYVNKPLRFAVILCTTLVNNALFFSTLFLSTYNIRFPTQVLQSLIKSYICFSIYKALQILTLRYFLPNRSYEVLFLIEKDISD